MYEYGVPLERHIELHRDPSELLRLAVGILGDLASAIARQEAPSEELVGFVEDVRFSARYFDAYANTRLAAEHNPLLRLLASASYYLCNLPGSSAVLTEALDYDELRALGTRGLASLLFWLLRGLPHIQLRESADSPYSSGLVAVARGLRTFYRSGHAREELESAVHQVRRLAYEAGTAREVLLADACCAVVIRRLANSARSTLPAYSQLPADMWASAFGKSTFMRELWPSQHLLGERGVFSGSSAVIQMPTSAGKSRATELIVRSGFLSGRVMTAVVVTPFRALCRETLDGLARAFQGESVELNALSDTFQQDFDIGSLLSDRTIVVVTPEKLVYVLRHNPEFASSIGLLVLDEGHQFDTGRRGITYELMVTSLKGLIPPEAQKVLISAVISNASQINTWLNEGGGEVVAGTSLLPTERSVALASWKHEYGRLEFVDPKNPANFEFFVPRIIESTQLRLRKREHKERRFPEPGDSNSIALYLGLRLHPQGSIAIFCGRKDTARTHCRNAVDAFDRGLKLRKPIESSDAEQVRRLSYLYVRNLGPESDAAKASAIGIFSHHGNTPHGVRLAVEFGMKKGHGRFVVCTSTLAQGVNLPIRYLLVTGTRTGREEIKVRDFHNLMGRAGRSGMHTEGTVLFSDPAIFDKRGESWRNFESLLRIENTEPCASSLLNLLGPISSDNKRTLRNLDPLALARLYIADVLATGAWIPSLARALSTGQRGFTEKFVRQQLEARKAGLATIESFLLAHWPDGDGINGVEDGGGEQDLQWADDLARSTLAYHLADTKRDQLAQLFQLLAQNIMARVPEPSRRQAFGRTLFGLSAATGLEDWVDHSAARLLAAKNDHERFDTVWGCLEPRIENTTFRKCNPAEETKRFAEGWLNGDSFGKLCDEMSKRKVRIGTGKKPRRPTVEYCVELGETALGFDGAHILGAVIELIQLRITDLEAKDIDPL